jgi:hypothetical protein
MIVIQLLWRDHTRELANIRRRRVGGKPAG